MDSYAKLLESIRKKCIWCMDGHYSDVEVCPATDCALHRYRRGVKPKKTRRKMTEKEKADRRAKMDRLDNL